MCDAFTNVVVVFVYDIHGDDMHGDVAAPSNPNLYGRVMPDLDEYTKDPPPLPPHLRHIILNKVCIWKFATHPIACVDVASVPCTAVHLCLCL